MLLFDVLSGTLTQCSESCAASPLCWGPAVGGGDAPCCLSTAVVVSVQEQRRFQQLYLQVCVLVSVLALREAVRLDLRADWS